MSSYGTTVALHRCSAAVPRISAESVDFPAAGIPQRTHRQAGTRPRGPASPAAMSYQTAASKLTFLLVLCPWVFAGESRTSALCLVTTEGEHVTSCCNYFKIKPYRVKGEVGKFVFFREILLKRASCSGLICTRLRLS